MNYDALKLEVLKTDVERLRLLAIQEEWYAIFEGELEGKDFEDYHDMTQEIAFKNSVDYWTHMMEQNLWNEIVKDWGEQYVIDVWLNDRQSTEQLKQRINNLRKQKVGVK